MVNVFYFFFTIRTISDKAAKEHKVKEKASPSPEIEVQAEAPKLAVLDEEALNKNLSKRRDDQAWDNQKQTRQNNID